MVILEFDFKSLNDKIVNSASSPSKSQEQKREMGNWGSSSFFFREGFKERDHFSLDLHTIRPLAIFGPRRKNVLRGAGYAWTPDL